MSVELAKSINNEKYSGNVTPLQIIQDSGGGQPVISVVIHDTTLTGDGTATTPLGISATILTQISNAADLAGTALQPNDNISELNNDAGYLTAGDFAPVATTGDYNDLTNKPTIPTTASDVGALPDSTKYAANMVMTINSTTYVLTAQLKDQDGNNIGNAQTVDLPLESVVVSGYYDNTTKKVVLTLQSGSTIEFSVADLVSGLQSEITAQNPLNADLVDDSTSTNKFVTAGEKSTWNNKQDAISDLSTIRSGAQAGATAVQPGSLATVATTGDYDDLSNKPTIPAPQVNADWNANSGVAQILNKPTLGTAASASATDFATAAQGVKADTAVQPSALATVATTGQYSDLSGKPTIPTVNDGTLTISQNGTVISTFSANQSGNTSVNISTSNQDPWLWTKAYVSQAQSSSYNFYLSVNYGAIADIPDGLYCLMVRSPRPTPYAFDDKACHKIYIEIKNGVPTWRYSNLYQTSKTCLVPEPDYAIGATQSWAGADYDSMSIACAITQSGDLVISGRGYTNYPCFFAIPTGVYNWWSADTSFEYTQMIETTSGAQISAQGAEVTTSEPSTADYATYGSIRGSNPYFTNVSWATYSNYTTGVTANSYQYIYLFFSGLQTPDWFGEGSGSSMPREFFASMRATTNNGGTQTVLGYLTIRVVMTHGGGYVEVFENTGVFADIDTYKLYLSSQGSGYLYFCKQNSATFDFSVYSQIKGEFSYLGRVKTYEPAFRVYTNNSLPSSGYYADLKWFNDLGTVINNLLNNQ